MQSIMQRANPLHNEGYNLKIILGPFHMFISYTSAKKAH